MTIKRLLLTRFSAMGDVAMCVPVVWSLAEKFPDVEIFFLSRRNFAPMFAHCPKNVRFIGVDLKNDYKGFSGLNRLFAEIKALNIDAYADLHDVMRTKYLRLRSCLSGIKTAKIDKGRGEKKRLVRRGAERCKPLKTTVERYRDVLGGLGFDFEINFTSVYGGVSSELPGEIRTITGEKSQKWVGVAPFAAHQGKILPLDKTEDVVRKLSERGCKVFLFGAGEKERSVLEGWQSKYNDVVSVAGKLGGLGNELLLIAKLDCMLSMDSANMHLASLVGTRAVSVWGATHPAAGFMGYGQKETDAVQVELLCRPCSIYGNKKCCQSDQYKCLTQIQADAIVDRILNPIK